MAERISTALRQLVAQRAYFVCEYCLIAEEDTFLGCEVDHIISLKHGGETVESNLAYACVYCNRYKGTDIASLSDSGKLTPLFNPRMEEWNDHFRLKKHQILPLSQIGEVTIKTLRLNLLERLLEREALLYVQRYPSASALQYLAAK